MIKEKKHYNNNENPNYYTDPHEPLFDYKEALSQFSRILYQPESIGEFYRILSVKPLVTNSKKEKSFCSWRGRAVSIYFLGKSFVSEPYKLIKHLIVLIHLTALTTLNTLNFIFSNEARKETFTLYLALIGVVSCLAVRPIAFALDCIKLTGGLFIPALAIQYDPEGHKDF